MIEDFKVLPLFTSHYSIGRSVLTLHNKDDNKKKRIHPTSIIDICQENEFKTCILLEDRYGGFVDADKNLAAIGCDLIFGIRLTCCQNLTEKNEESLNTEHKINVFSASENGRTKLKKIYSKSWKDGFYYQPRIDLQSLAEVWDDEDLVLAIPYYDSFLFQNNFFFKSIIPDFSFTKPVFFKQNNGLAQDILIDGAIDKFTAGNYEIFKAKSIFYKNREDFLEYMTFRCIKNKTTLEKPELEEFSSDEFCFESWKEQNQAEETV